MAAAAVWSISTSFWQDLYSFTFFVIGGARRWCPVIQRRSDRRAKRHSSASALIWLRVDLVIIIFHYLTTERMKRFHSTWGEKVVRSDSAAALSFLYRFIIWLRAPPPPPWPDVTMTRTKLSFALVSFVRYSNVNVIHQCCSIQEQVVSCWSEMQRTRRKKGHNERSLSAPCVVTLLFLPPTKKKCFVFAQLFHREE